MQAGFTRPVWDRLGSDRVVSGEGSRRFQYRQGTFEPTLGQREKRNALIEGCRGHICFAEGCHGYY